jgi:hypothetical protein
VQQFAATHRSGLWMNAQLIRFMSGLLWDKTHYESDEPWRESRRVDEMLQ